MQQKLLLSLIVALKTRRGIDENPVSEVVMARRLKDMENQFLFDFEQPKQKVYSLRRNTSVIERAKMIDWNFTDAVTQYLTHKYHAYPARFIPQIPRALIEICTSKPSDIVFDIFSGCGTTVVEARLAHRNTIGIELNPLGILISKAKSTPLNPTLLRNGFDKLCGDIAKRLNPDLLRNYTEKEIDEYRHILFPQHLLNQANEEYAENREIYMDYMIKGRRAIHIHLNSFCLLSLIKNNIDELEESDGIKTFFLTALSSVINRLKNSTSQKKLQPTLPLQLFTVICKSMIAEMEDFYERVSPETFTRIIGADARTIDDIVESNSATCIVTSPPYPNALDYHREHKSNLLWLGLPFRNFQSREIGAHSKFASNRLRMLSQYISDMIRASIQMARVLKPNKYCCIVVGNSSVEHLIIENHQFLKKVGEVAGLDFEYEVLRNIDKTRKYTSWEIGNIDDEYVMFFRKREHNRLSPNDIAMCVKEMMINLREDFAAGRVKFDTKVLRYSLRRFFKGQNLTLEEGKKVYRKRNLKKLDQAIANVEQDIFKAG